jgi:hypothetical protein
MREGRKSLKELLRPITRLWAGMRKESPGERSYRNWTSSGWLRSFKLELSMQNEVPGFCRRQIYHRDIE